MALKRMDNVGIVVESLYRHLFLSELGLELEGRATIEESGQGASRGCVTSASRSP